MFLDEMQSITGIYSEESKQESLSSMLYQAAKGEVDCNLSFI